MKLDRFAAAFALACATLMACGHAAAQTIYRCGNEYTRIPCSNGRPIDADDHRTAAQRAEARRSVAQQQLRAREMERDRHDAEAAIKPALASSLSAPRAAEPAASAPKRTKPKKKPAKPLTADNTDFIASVPGSARKTAGR